MVYGGLVKRGNGSYVFEEKNKIKYERERERERERARVS